MVSFPVRGMMQSQRRISCCLSGSSPSEPARALGFSSHSLPHVFRMFTRSPWRRICLQWVGGTVQTISETDHVGCPPVWRMISLKCTSDAFIAPPLESLEKQPSAPAVRQQTPVLGSPCRLGGAGWQETCICPMPRSVRPRCTSGGGLSAIVHDKR